jgi:tetratricopeptide (TPR) repeat protein
MAPLSASALAELRALCAEAKRDPAVLHDPSLGELRELLTSLGGKLPAAPTPPAPEAPAAPSGNEDLLDDECVLTPDVASQEMGPTGDAGEPSEEARFVHALSMFCPKPPPYATADATAAAPAGRDRRLGRQERRRGGSRQRRLGGGRGQLHDGAEGAHLRTHARRRAFGRCRFSCTAFLPLLRVAPRARLQVMPSALTYAKRAECFLKLRQLNAAIMDANAALALNPDSAKGFKARGTAQRLLGNWEAAAKDLGQGLNIDFDEASDATLKVVLEKAAVVRKRRVDAENAEKQR